jgi:hypothetical protein
VSGCCECCDEPSGFCDTELVASTEEEVFELAVSKVDHVKSVIFFKVPVIVSYWPEDN